jgi:hypothetical protein
MNFLKKLPSGTITADNVQSFGQDAYLHTGMYTFMTGPAEDRKPVEARFSYMWRKVDGVWKIVHHHSSAVPKIPGTKEADECEDMYPIAQASHISLEMDRWYLCSGWCMHWPYSIHISILFKTTLVVRNQ